MSSDATLADFRVDLDTAIASVGRELSDAFGSLLTDIIGHQRRPQQLGRTLGLKKDLAGRILFATSKKDPLAVAHFMPGPEALRRLVAAAEKKGAQPEVVSRASQAVTDFERLIHRFAGDRAALDGIISAWLPEAREKVEVLSKQAAYKGMVGIKGAAADINLSTAILHACPDGKHHDGVWISGALGLRRQRPGAVVKFATRRVHPPTEKSPRTLDGNPVDNPGENPLDAFCSSPAGQLEVRREGDVVHYVLGGHGAGLGSAVDVLVATASPCCISRYQGPGRRRKRGPFAEIATPVAELIFDVLLHDEVYPDSVPTIVMYDTVFDGSADTNDPSRDIDRLNLAAAAVPLGRGPSVLRISEFSNYVDMIRYVLGKMRWDPEGFRAYRCRVPYPVYGSQIHMLFDAPSAPSETTPAAGPSGK
jgi:hypothetical protein